MLHNNKSFNASKAWVTKKFDQQHFSVKDISESEGFEDKEIK
jgi:hypothetical protein